MESQEALQNEFGRRLRLVREKRGLSQEKLALICGLARTYVSSVDRGERNISLLNIWRLAETLDVNPSIFFTQEDEFAAALNRLTPLDIQIEHVIHTKSA